MVITFGNRFYGKVATVNGQWVETVFFSIMFLPIFPVSSFFVTGSGYNKRNGFTIALQRKSILAAYGRLLSFVFAGWTLMYAMEAWSRHRYNYGPGTVYEPSYDRLTYSLLTLLFAALWVYFCFYFGKASPADVLIRHKVGSITGYYTMPHWFDYPQLRNTLGDFDLKYKTEYPGSDWKADLMGDNIHSQKLALLYGLALFNCMVYDLPENDDLYARADSLYVPRSLS